MTNHDELCENLPRYMFHIDDAGRASMKQDPIGAYIHIADLKQALKLSDSCEGMLVVHPDKIKEMEMIHKQCLLRDAQVIEELRTRVADWRADAVKHAQEVLELRARLSTLLKASEGIEKALEEAVRDCEVFDVSGVLEKNFPSTIHAIRENQKRYALALADFRAVKEGK